MSLKSALFHKFCRVSRYASGGGIQTLIIFYSVLILERNTVVLWSTISNSSPVRLHLMEYVIYPYHPFSSLMTTVTCCCCCCCCCCCWVVASCVCNHKKEWEIILKILEWTIQYVGVKSQSLLKKKNNSEVWFLKIQWILSLSRASKGQKNLSNIIQKV